MGGEAKVSDLIEGIGLHLIIGKGKKDELHPVAARYRVIANTASFQNRIKTRLT